MKTIKQKYLINASKQKVWQALVDPRIINEWGGGPAKMDEKVGTRFKLWGGEVQGKNIKVVKNEELVQDWKEEDWDEFSKVTFKLTSKGEKTELELIHEGVPDSEYIDITDGWSRYYLGPLKEIIERLYLNLQKV